MEEADEKEERVLWQRFHMIIHMNQGYEKGIPLLISKLESLELNGDIDPIYIKSIKLTGIYSLPKRKDSARHDSTFIYVEFTDFYDYKNDLEFIRAYRKIRDCFDKNMTAEEQEYARMIVPILCEYENQKEFIDNRLSLGCIYEWEPIESKTKSASKLS